MSNLKLAHPQFSPPPSLDHVKKKRELIAILRHKWPRWEAMAAIETIYGGYAYSTLMVCIKLANEDENNGVDKPALPVWLKAQKNYSERADELANAHDEQMRQYKENAKSQKSKTEKKSKKNQQKIWDAFEIVEQPVIEPKPEPAKENKAQAIAKELQKGEEESSDLSLEKNLAIAELYMEVRALKFEIKALKKSS